MVDGEPFSNTDEKQNFERKLEQMNEVQAKYRKEYFDKKESKERNLLEVPEKSEDKSGKLEEIEEIRKSLLEKVGI